MAGPIVNWLGGALGGVKQGSRTFEPQRMNSALLYVSGLSKFGDDGVAGKSESLTLSLANFSMPKIQTAPTVIPFLSEMRKYAGQTVYEGIQASFYDYVDRKTLSVLLNWKYAVHDPRTGQKGYKGNYALDGRIEEYPPQDSISAGAGQMVSWSVFGMWPTLLDPGDYDMGSDEPVRISVHFEIDKAYPTNLPMLTPASSRNVSNSVTA